MVRDSCQDEIFPKENFGHLALVVVRLEDACQADDCFQRRMRLERMRC